MWPLELGDLTRGERISSLWRESAALDEIRGYRNRDRETCGGCEHRTLCEYCPGLSYQQHEDGLQGADATCDTTYVRAKTNAIAGGVQTPVPLPAGLAKKPFRILNR